VGFMDSTLQVFVTIAAVDMLTGPVSGMAGSMGILDQRTKEVQSTMAGFRNMAFIGAGITGIGVALAAGLINAANKAGELQTALTSLKETMGLTSTEFQKTMNLAQTLGIPTQFTAIQTAGIMTTAYNAGLSKSAILDPNVMRQFVNFADVQAFGIKKEDPNTATQAAVRAANMLGVSGTAPTAKFLDTFNAALANSTDTATQFVTNLKYFYGTAEQKGMSAGDIITANTWLSRMGLGGGRGGMATQEFLSRSVYGSSGAPADAAMQAAGLVVNGHSVFEDAAGVFVGFPEAMKALQDFNTREGGNGNIIGPLLTKIFGVSGMRVAQALMQQTAAPQYSQVTQEMGSTAGVNAQQAALNANWAGQTKQLTSTLGDIWTSFGFSAMNSLLPLVTSVNKLLYNLLLFMQAHPVLANLVADFAKFGAAIALTVGPLLTIVGVFKWLQVAGTISTMIKMTSSAFQLLADSTKIAAAAQWLFNLAMDVCPFVLVAAGLALIVVGLVELVEHFKEVYQWLDNLWHAWHKFDNMPSQTPASVAAANEGSNAGSTISANAQKQVNTAVKSSPIPGGAGARYHYASGTNYAPGGWSEVGEHGRELVNLSPGSQVINNATTEGLLGGVSMGDVNINIYPTSNQSPAAIAKAIPREIAGVIRNVRRSRGLRPVTAY